MTGECTCDWPPGNPMAVHRSWCPARPSGLLEGQGDPGARAAFQSLSDDLRTKYGMLDAPPKTPAAGPRRTGEATVAGRAVAKPGTPEVNPVTDDGVPGQTSRPGRAQEPAAGTGTSGVQKWKDAIAANNRAKRNRRGKRPGPQITGVRIPPPGGER